MESFLNFMYQFDTTVAVGIVLALIFTFRLVRMHNSEDFPEFDLASVVMHDGKVDKFALFFVIWNLFFLWLTFYLVINRNLTFEIFSLICAVIVTPLVAKVIWGKPIVVSSVTESFRKTETSAAQPPSEAPPPVQPTDPAPTATRPIVR